MLTKELDLACGYYRTVHKQYPWAKPDEVKPNAAIDPVKVYAELTGGPGAVLNTTQDYVGQVSSRVKKNRTFVDHWGRAIQFRVNPQTSEPVIWSCGPNRRDETNDGDSPDSQRKPMGYYWFGKGDFGDDIVVGAEPQ
jgi:hypothetical protein